MRLNSGFLGSLIDGLILGGLLALILVRIRGPLFPEAREPKSGKRGRKGRKARETPVPESPRQATLSDYLTAWATLGVIVASASYAVSGGHGTYGFITGSIKALQSVSQPARLALMMLLSLLFFGAMGAALWSAIWWVSILVLRLIRKSWAERSRVVHGALFGSVVGGLLGLSVCINEAIAGNILGPIELLLKR